MSGARFHHCDVWNIKIDWTPAESLLTPDLSANTMDDDGDDKDDTKRYIKYSIDLFHIHTTHRQYLFRLTTNHVMKTMQ